MSDETPDELYHTHMQELRDARRLKRRRTRMVLDNAGVRNLKAVTRSDATLKVTRKKPGKR